MKIRLSGSAECFYWKWLEGHTYNTSYHWLVIRHNVTHREEHQLVKKAKRYFLNSAGVSATKCCALILRSCAINGNSPTSRHWAKKFTQAWVGILISAHAACPAATVVQQPTVHQGRPKADATDAAALGPAPWCLGRLFIFSRYSLSFQ